MLFGFVAAGQEVYVQAKKQHCITLQFTPEQMINSGNIAILNVRARPTFPKRIELKSPGTHVAETGGRKPMDLFTYHLPARPPR
jgi:hypothetical protein